RAHAPRSGNGLGPLEKLGASTEPRHHFRIAANERRSRIWVGNIRKIWRTRRAHIAGLYTNPNTICEPGDTSMMTISRPVNRSLEYGRPRRYPTGFGGNLANGFVVVGARSPRVDDDNSMHSSSALDIPGHAV